MRRPLIYSPIALLFSTVLVILFVMTAFVLFLGLVSTSFTRIGFSWHDALLLLFVSWLGSHVNVPIATVRSRAPAVTSGFIRVFGVVYRVPLLVEAQRDTVLAVNVGGAVVPSLVSLYLMVRFPEAIPYALSAVLVVAVVMHAIARPVRGVGIVIPALVPPVAAAIISTVLVGVPGGPEAARFVTAYVSGTLGTLIGADILNLGSLAELGAPVASIGGAGTFDGVFLTGLIAVLLV